MSGLAESTLVSRSLPEQKISYIRWGISNKDFNFSFVHNSLQCFVIDGSYFCWAINRFKNAVELVRADMLPHSQWVNHAKTNWVTSKPSIPITPAFFSFGELLKVGCQVTKQVKRGKTTETVTSVETFEFPFPMPVLLYHYESKSLLIRPQECKFEDFVVPLVSVIYNTIKKFSDFDPLPTGHEFSEPYPLLQCRGKRLEVIRADSKFEVEKGELKG